MTQIKEPNQHVPNSHLHPMDPEELTLLHSEGPKLLRVLAFLSAKGLSEKTKIRLHGSTG